MSMSDFGYGMLYNEAQRTFNVKERSSFDPEKYRRDLLSKPVVEENSYWYLSDVLTKYKYYLEEYQKKDTSTKEDFLEYSCQFSDNISRSKISSLTDSEITARIFSFLKEYLPSHPVAYFYGCRNNIPIYPVRELLAFPSIQKKIKEKMVCYYVTGTCQTNYKCCNLNIKKITLELKECGKGAYLFVNFPEDVDYEAGSLEL